MNFIENDDIDFEAYLKETDHEQKVRQANNWVAELEAELVNPVTERKIYLPWEKTKEYFDFKKGEVTIYAGSNGGGKSLMTGMIALSLVQQGQKVCIASFEMKPKRTLKRMVRQFACFNFDEPSFYKSEVQTYRILEDFKKFNGDNMWFYDQQGTITSDQIIAVTRYCAQKLGIQHMFIDSLMKCVAGEDAYNEQKHFIDELTSIARDYNIHIHIIHHIRKLSNEELTPNKHDIKGSGAITDQVDNVFIIWRNKKKEHQRSSGMDVDIATPDAYLMNEKQRNGESEEWFSLWFDKNSQQFLEQPDGKTIDYRATVATFG